MWPASHSDGPRARRGSGGRVGLHAVVQVGDGRRARSARPGGAPRASSSCRRPGSRPMVRDADRRGEARRAPGVVVVAADQDDRCPGSAIQASLEPKPARSAVMRHGAGHVGLVELEVGAHVHDQRAVGAAAASTWRGVSGWASTPSARSGPRLSVDDALEVRRLRPEPGERALRRSVLVVDSASSGVVARARSRSSSDDLHGPCPGRRTASRRGGPARPRTSRAAPAAARAASGRCRARPPPAVDGEVGAGDVADEERVAGQHRPRLRRRASVSISANAVCSGRWPGVCIARTRTRAELELPAVLERLVVVLGAGRAVDVDGRAGGRGQPPVARDVVGVVVGLEDVLDARRPR